jgi:hypothetical protein
MESRGLERQNARQILSRLTRKGQLWRSEHFRLPGGERIFSLLDFWGTEGFCNQVAELVGQTPRKGIARCLAVLGAEDALLPVQARKLLASPTKPVKARYPEYESEVQALRELGIVVMREGTPFEHLTRAGLKVPEASTTAALESMSRLKVECLLARLLVNGFRKQNVMTWNRYELPSLETGFTEFSHQLFTAYGYSYLGPLVRHDHGAKQKPCPVLLDVHAGRCRESDVESFVQRIGRVEYRPKSRMPCLGIIAAKEFTDTAWKSAKRAGLMTINLRQMFGDEALQAMVLVEELLGGVSNGAMNQDEGLQEFTSLLKALKANPVVVTIRSLAFEALAVMIIQADGFQSAGLSKNVPFGDTSREVDVYGHRGDMVYVIECKAIGENKALTAPEVKKFYTETVPAYLGWLRQRGDSPKSCQAEIWSTGRVGIEASEELAKLKLGTITTARLRDGDEVASLLPTRLKVRGGALLNAIRLCGGMDETES